MSRLDIKTPDRAQMVVDPLYHDMERRIASSPPGLCPIDMARNFLNLCHAQTCGKCVPCRIGLGQLSTLMGKILEGKGKMEDLQVLEDTARTIECTSSCAIGYHAARLVLKGLEGFRDDYIEHIQNHRCLGNLENPVPCVALCPAGVDIPGYIALIHEGRCADAVRLIRKDNPFPVACAYICEHPCEARCRRNMLDDPLNIRGLKRYAVDNAGDVPQPPCASPTGKTVAVIGGGPGGLSAAYYLALMGHSVTVYEQRKQLGGMLRYGIPSYRFPRELLDREIASILSLGITVHTETHIGTDMLKELNEYNIQGIGYTDCGSRCFYTTEPVQKLEDLKGMKIRVQSNDLMLAMTDALGCNSVNVAANEVYSAVQTGVVQGGENNANIYLSDSLYEVAPYYILDNHIISPDVICVNLDVWNSLSAEDQAIFNEAMANATAYQRQLWNEAVDQSLEKVKEGGATVFEPDEATLQEFQDAMAPVYEKYGTELQDWIDRINTELGNE